jgi:hypothetical protein
MKKPPKVERRNRRPELNDFLDRLERRETDGFALEAARDSGYGREVDRYEAGEGLPRRVVVRVLLFELRFRAYMAAPSWDDLDADSKRLRTRFVFEARQGHGADLRQSDALDQLLNSPRAALPTKARNLRASVLGAAEDAYESDDRLRLWRSGRVRAVHGPSGALGERQRWREKHDQLKKDLGPGFVDVDAAPEYRAQKVREWLHERRKRTDVVRADANGQRLRP